jgi:hypothetical protein
MELENDVSAKLEQKIKENQGFYFDLAERECIIAKRTKCNKEGKDFEIDDLKEIKWLL